MFVIHDQAEGTRRMTVFASAIPIHAKVRISVKLAVQICGLRLDSHISASETIDDTW